MASRTVSMDASAMDASANASMILTDDQGVAPPKSPALSGPSFPTELDMTHEAVVEDDSKPELFDHPLAPEHVLLRAPVVRDHGVVKPGKVSQ